MTENQMLVAVSSWLVLMGICYTHSGWRNMRDCYMMWFSKEYWTAYNTVEFISWWAKAFIIVPGLVFGIQVWQLYYLTLLTSVSLIWASRKKALPTLVGFNTMWSWLSLMVLSQHWVS